MYACKQKQTHTHTHGVCQAAVCQKLYKSEGASVCLSICESYNLNRRVTDTHKKMHFSIASNSEFVESFLN